MIIVTIIVPRTRAKVAVPEVDIKYILGHSKFTFEQVNAFIQKILNETLDLTVKETEEWIDEFVPKRSGDLIESLKKFLNKSKPPTSTAGEIRGVRLILGVGAEVPYAKYVMDFTDEQVQHANTWREHSGKKAYSKGQPVLMNDPEARGMFFEMLLIYAVERLRTNLTKIKWVNIKSGG